MASLEHSVAPPASDHAATSTGLPNLKLAMWLFLASDCLLFGALISTYLLYRGASIVGPYPNDVFDIPFTSVSSFVLLMSTLTMVLALAAIQRGDIGRSQGLAARHRAARDGVPRRAGLRVHDVRPRGADAEDQPVRHVASSC